MITSSNAKVSFMFPSQWMNCNLTDLTVIDERCCMSSTYSYGRQCIQLLFQINVITLFRQTSDKITFLTTPHVEVKRLANVSAPIELGC